jgi:hypothetical protein
MKKQNLFQRTIFFFFLSIALNSCSSFNPEPTIKNIENCLGNTKTSDDLNGLTLSERVEIAKCILPHLKEFDDQRKEFSKEEEREAYLKLNEILEKSEYKEVMKTMNYEGVKSFLEENAEKTE